MMRGFITALGFALVTLYVLLYVFDAFAPTQKKQALSQTQARTDKPSPPTAASRFIEVLRKQADESTRKATEKKTAEKNQTFVAICHKEGWESSEICKVLHPVLLQRERDAEQQQRYEELHVAWRR